MINLKDWYSWENEFKLKAKLLKLLNYLIDKIPLLKKLKLPDITLKRYDKKVNIVTAFTGLNKFIESIIVELEKLNLF